jgi:hypothetical protein
VEQQVLTLGYDIANRTGLCAILWNSGNDPRGRIVGNPNFENPAIEKLDLEDRSNVGKITSWTEKVVRNLNLPIDTLVACGIDQPFGLPKEFVDTVNNFNCPDAHKIEGGDCQIYRKTDEVLKRDESLAGITPLSPVTSNMTGNIVYRCAALRRALTAHISNLDGRENGVFEVYPAAFKHRLNGTNLYDQLGSFIQTDDRLKKSLRKKSGNADTDKEDAIICAIMARLCLAKGSDGQYITQRNIDPKDEKYFKVEGYMHNIPKDWGQEGSMQLSVKDRALKLLSLAYDSKMTISTLSESFGLKGPTTP